MHVQKIQKIRWPKFRIGELMDLKNKCLVVVLCLCSCLTLTSCSVCPPLDPDVPDYDVVVYGGTSSGVMAAVQAVRMGKRVALVSPERHLGGMTSGGLGWTDTGNTSTIGGLARYFYHCIWTHYQSEDAWTWQPSEAYGNQGQGVLAMDGSQRTMWCFEPHVAEAVFEKLVSQYGIPVFREYKIDRDKGVKMEGQRIVSLKML